LYGFVAHWITVVWDVWLILWLLAAFGSKRTVQRQSQSSRLAQAALMVFGFYLIFGPVSWLPFPALRRAIFPAEDATAWTGLALVGAGMLFSFWARAVIGRNWSGTVTLKENHELVRRGPYRLVRHPIYTGLLAAATGTAVIYLRPVGFVGLLVIAASFWYKLRTEEEFMVQHFGEEYRQYRMQVRALIPFVL
jgi:protein-S-isoprenylcysteine O-methyltransferase Ste14